MVKLSCSANQGVLGTTKHSDSTVPQASFDINILRKTEHRDQSLTGLCHTFFFCGSLCSHLAAVHTAIHELFSLASLHDVSDARRQDSSQVDADTPVKGRIFTEAGISCNNTIGPASRLLIDDINSYELHTQESPKLWLPYQVFIVPLYWIRFLPIQCSSPIRGHSYHKQVSLATQLTYCIIRLLGRLSQS